MQKDISSEINTIKQREIYDINCAGIVSSDIEITLSNVQFPSVESCSTNIIEIPNVITGNFNDLVNRKMIITGSEELNLDKNGLKFSIISTEIRQDKILCTINTNLIVKKRISAVEEIPEEIIDPVPPETEPTIIPAIPGIPEHVSIESGLNVFIERDVPLENELYSCLGFLNLPNSNTLTQSDVLTTGEFFSKNEIMCTTLLQHTSAYKDENIFNSRIGEVNDFMRLSIIDYSREQLIDYKNKIITTVNLVNKLHRDVIEYYDKIKSVILKFKLSDLKMKGKESDELLETRSQADKDNINYYYQYSLDNGEEAYKQLKDDAFDSIKIQ